eukprot:gene3674-4576_t
MIHKLANFIDHFSTSSSSSSSKRKQIFISTCTSVEKIDPSLTRAGRIDKFIHLVIPSQSKRLQILNSILKDTNLYQHLNTEGKDDDTPSSLSSDILINQKNNPDKFNQFITELSKITPGFLYRDIYKLVRTTLLIASSRGMECDGLKFCDFQEALLTVSPQNLLHFDVTLQNTKWSDIGGYKDVKDRFKELIEWPIKYPDVFKRLALQPSSGVLLHGPSGCGKTLIVKAVASTLNINFISIKGSDIYSKWLGDSERIIRDIFARARLSAPCILFFDEIDSMAISRGGGSSGKDEGEDGVQGRILSQLLNEMDGIQVKSQIFLMGCTTNLELLDSALIRPGRFEPIHIDLPNESDRLEILKVITKNMNSFSNEIDWNEISKQTQGFTGANLYQLCNDAGMIQLDRNMNSDTIEKESLLESLNRLIKK